MTEGIKNLILDVLSYIDNDGFTLEESEFYAICDEIELLDDKNIVTAMLDVIKEQGGPAAVKIAFLLRFVRILPTLPHNILVLMEKKPSMNSRYPLMFLYSMLFYLGYPNLDAREKIEARFEINREGYNDFVSELVRDHGAPDSHPMDIVNELYEMIDEIVPFSRQTRYTDGNGAFSCNKRVKLPIKKYIQNLEHFYTEWKKNNDIPFMQCVDDFHVDLASPRAKEIAKLFTRNQKRGEYGGLLKKLIEIEKLEGGNPRVFYEKSKLIGLISEQNGTVAHESTYEYLERALRTPLESHKYDYYLEITGNLQVMGYFHASYVLSLSLLRFQPWNFGNVLCAAYNAYQLALPFKHMLEHAAAIDPPRLINFLDEYWFPYRFKPQDSFARLEVESAYVKRLEEETFGCAGFQKNPNTMLPRAGETPDDLQDMSKKEILDYITGKLLDALEEIDYSCFSDEYNGGEPQEGAGEDLEDLEPDEADDWFDEISISWRKSKEYNDLPKYTWKVRDDIPWMAIKLYYMAHEALPEGWNWQKLKSILLNKFPSNVVAPQYYFKSVGRVMQNFCSYLHLSRGMKNMAMLPEKIKDIKSRIYDRSQNPSNWNQGKKFYYQR